MYGKSLIYFSKNTELSIEPCGTPCLAFSQ
jgi:hypothetical protein